MFARNYHVRRRCLLPLALTLLLIAILARTAPAQLVPGAEAPATHPPTIVIPPTQPPSMQAPAPQPPAAQVAGPALDTPAAVVPAGWGLCQCISDTKALDFSCPGSAAGCQASCGGHYSYMPTAQCKPAQ
jgi:hypothetical protein